VPNSAPTNRLATAGLVVAFVVLIGVAAALFDLGPFAKEKLTGNQFLVRGDEVCSGAHHRFSQQQQAQPRTASEAVDLTTNLRDLARTELDQMRQLTPPAALEQPLDRYLAAREDAIKLMDRAISAAGNDDFTAYRTYQAKLAGGQRQRLRLAKAVGFKECSQPSVGGKELREQSQPPQNESLNRPNEVNNPPPGTP
jgi:hypothetical protein